MRSPIINRPDLQNCQHRTVSGVLTLVFWAFWFYLWLPLLALLAWALGVQQAYKYMIVLGGYQEVLRLIGIYTLVIVTMGGGLVAWATYNIVRFGRLDRRSGMPSPTAEQFASYFQQAPPDVASWQRAQCLCVTHDEKGGIAGVEILIGGAVVPEEQDDAAAEVEWAA